MIVKEARILSPPGRPLDAEREAHVRLRLKPELPDG